MSCSGCLSKSMHEDWRVYRQVHRRCLSRNLLGVSTQKCCMKCLPKYLLEVSNQKFAWGVYLNICLRCLTKSLHGVSTQIFAWGVHPKVCNGVSIMRSEAGTFIAGTQHNSSLPRAVASYRCLKQLYKCRSCCLFYLSFFNFFVVSLMLFCFFSNVHSAFLYFLFSCFSRFSCTAVLLT